MREGKEERKKEGEKERRRERKRERRKNCIASLVNLLPSCNPFTGCDSSEDVPRRNVRQRLAATSSWQASCCRSGAVFIAVCVKQSPLLCNVVVCLESRKTISYNMFGYHHPMVLHRLNGNFLLGARNREELEAIHTQSCQRDQKAYTTRTLDTFFRPK